MTAPQGTHWVIRHKHNAYLYLTERRGPAYGRKQREWKALSEAAVFPNKGAATRAAGQASRYAGEYEVVSVGLFLGIIQ